jgi:transcriptional regulator with XRE-family HTH domain
LIVGILRDVDDLYRAFGHTLRQARLDAGLTQRLLAERVGLRRTSITNIERGTQHISLHQLFLLAGALGVRPDELLPDANGHADDGLPAEALGDLDELRVDDDGRAFAIRVLRKNAAVARAADDAGDSQ